jgi:rod shape-determining protein MreD
MRRVILSAVLLAAVLILQLTLINGLRLPGGGVPDLVLVMVAALGLANGPAVGAICGFAAGFCLDIAPPASGIIGEYALVLCLVGWACGRLSGTLARSAWLPIIISAAAAAVGEVLVAALGMALQPAQVSFASVRAVLPAAVIYDIALTPFVLYLVLLVTARLDEEAAASAGAGQARLRRARAQGGVLVGGQATGRQGLAGTPGAASGAVLLGLGGWLAGPPQSRRARRAAARRTPRLGSGRAGDGWIGSSASARLLGGAPLTTRSVNTLTGRSGAARLRSGVAGSAAGGQAPRTLAGRPVHLRLAAASKRDGRLGAGKRVVIGRGLSRTAVSGLGRRRSRRNGGFRPSALPGGSATAQVRRRPLAATPARIDFGSGHHGTSHHPAGGQGSVIHLGSRRRMFAGRRRDGVVGGGALTAAGRTGRPAAAPRFRIRPAGRGALSSATLASTAMMSGGPGSPSMQAFRPARPARLRMRSRRGDGMLGGGMPGGGMPGGGMPGGGMLGGGRPGGGLGSGRGHYGRPATPRFRSRPLATGRSMSGKRPRFRRRRWAVLSLITRRRTGPRRHLWLIGRTGDMGRIGRMERIGRMGRIGGGPK